VVINSLVINSVVINDLNIFRAVKSETRPNH
jgi:hypothetical protein